MEKQRILKELKDNGFIKFTCKDLDDGSYYDVEIKEVEKDKYITIIDGTSKQRDYIKLNSILDVLLYDEIYFF